MSYSEKDLEFALEQLSEMQPIRTKRMFGGVGIFKNDLMFAMMGGGAFRLKVDDTNRSDFESYGMEPLYPKNDKTKRPMDYYTVPVEVLENKEVLTTWAEKSFAIAVKNKK